MISEDSAILPEPTRVNSVSAVNVDLLPRENWQKFWNFVQTVSASMLLQGEDNLLSTNRDFFIATGDFHHAGGLRTVPVVRKGKV